jgi:PAS domain S-box-containing protein
MRPDIPQDVPQIRSESVTPSGGITEAIFDALLENSGDGIILFDSDWHITYASDSSERIMGFTPAELLRTPALEFVHPDDLARVKTQFEESLANPGKPVQIAPRIRHKDGSWRILEGVFTNLLHDPNVRGIVNNYRDITETIRAETALRESEEKFKRAFQSNPNSVSITRLTDGIFVDINDTHSRRTGYSREELVGKVSSATQWIDLEHRRWFLHRLLEQGRADMESSFRLKSGEVAVVNIAAVVVEIGGVPCALATSLNIGELKRTTEELRRSEERYRALVELAPYGIYRATREGRLLMVNSSLVKMVGYETTEEVLGLNLAIDVYKDPAERDRILERAQAGSGLPVEATWKRKDGSTISVRLAARLIYDKEGQLSETEVFVENITEQKALEKQLQTTQKMEAIGLLAGGVAHEFNNVLMIMRSNAELILSDASTSPDVNEQAQEIIRATQRAAGLTHQLLAFSRDQILEPVVLNLNVVLAELGGLLPNLMGKHIQITMIPAPDLGRVKVDRGQFEQVVMNLAINARDAMPDGGRLVIETSNVELDSDQPALYTLMNAGRCVLLSVTDTGVGMDKETLAHIFEPFFTTKEREKGTGLGLAMVYEAIQQNGCNISVCSAPGTGTSFKIYIPEVVEPAQSVRTEDLLPAPGGTETILLVEDEEALRKIGADFLRSKGYDVLTAEDGIEALKICQNLDRSIHLLVTDLIMPHMGGVELTKKALAMNPGLRTVYVSGYSGRALPQGPPPPEQPFLQKPFSLADLARQVRAALDATAKTERRLAS